MRKLRKWRGICWVSVAVADVDVYAPGVARVSASWEVLRAT